MIALTIALLLGQLGVCKEGTACRAANFKATQRPLGSCLPSSDGGFNSERGKIVYDYSDAGHYYQCDGKAWQLMEGQVGALIGTSLTLTPGPLAVGTLGISTDGGFISTYGPMKIGAAGISTDGGITVGFGAAAVQNDLVLSSTSNTRLGNSVNSRILGGTSAIIRLDDSVGSDIRYTSATSITLDGTNVTIVGPIANFSSTKNRGTKALTAGTGTVTVNASALCHCWNQTTPALNCDMPVTTTTGTLTSGAGTDTCGYFCF